MRFRLASGVVLAAALAPTGRVAPAAPADDRPRVVVLTDFFKDPDDKQSMIRLLVHSDEVELEGLIATSLAFGDGAVRPEWIRDLIDVYAEVHPNLRRHERPGSAFPEPEALEAIVKAGAPVIRAWAGRQKGFEVPYPPGDRDSRTCDPAGRWLGPGRDTEASEHIIRVVDRDDPRPVWVCVWGGAMDLAQALWKVRHTRPPGAASEFVGKLRVYQVSWQDTGSVWIWENFPELFLIQTSRAARGLFDEGPASLRDERWVRAHVTEGHGPLGAAYPPANAHGTLAINVKEGDSGSFLHLLAPGLGDPEHPEWGGWGGRFRRLDDRTMFFVDAADDHPTAADDPRRGMQWTLGRWNEALANEFAARMDWCVRDHADANHPPVVLLDGDDSRRVLRRDVASGEALTLSAAGTRDPDGDPVSYRWWHYREPGTFRGPLRLEHADSQEVSLVAPPVAGAETIHLILSATDHGDPPLTRYRRAIITVTPD